MDRASLEYDIRMIEYSINDGDYDMKTLIVMEESLHRLYAMRDSLIME